MRKRLAILAVSLMLLACRKHDINIVHGKLYACDVAEQLNILVGYNVGVGFKKTYYKSGLAKSVRTKTKDAFNNFDSLTFNFTYTTNKAHVTGSKLNYQYHSDGMGNNVHYTNDYPPEFFDFDVIFDSKHLYALKAGNTSFTYDNYGRLLSYDGFTLVYDNNGNILRVNGPDNLATIFTYDYHHAAKQQMYYSTGYHTNDMYNLMEIMNWIPVQPVNFRTSHMLSIGLDDNGEDISFGTFYFSGHVVNEEGLITSFNESFSENANDANPVNNTWSCRAVFKGNVK